MKLIKHSAVPASYCDPDVKLSVVGAFQVVEDLVTEMMGDLQIDGLTCMKKYGAMWLFVRNRIEMRTPLHWDEEYTAECYISSIGKARMTVDTVLKNTNSETAMASCLELGAVDLQTMKLRRTDTVGVNSGITAEPSENKLIFERGSFTPSSLLETVTVRSSDIDYCHHTNNISYIRFLMNRWTTAEISERPVRSVEVQYAGQTHEGDTLQIFACEESDPENGQERFVIRHGEMNILNCTVTRSPG